jgi:uncharacterized metal-binding protein
VGLLADRVSRKLRDDGFARMTCLAGVGADLSGFVMSAKSADENITIDGCPTACAKKALERVGASTTAYILTDMGCTKGSTPVTDELVEKMCGMIKNAAKTSSGSNTKESGCGCVGPC